MTTARDYILEKIQDYLVNKFLKTINASRAVILAVNTIISIDGLFILKLLLNKYGLSFLFKWFWWFSLL